MKVGNAILLSHVFVREDEKYKLDIIKLCVAYMRKYNPDSFIFMAGHGLAPDIETLDLCDAFIWQESIIEKDINVGHPNLVNRSLNKLQEMGFTYVCKARLDSILTCSDHIADHCHSILTEENKLKLISTTNNLNYYMGDLFCYGSIDFLKACWNEDTWHPTATGLSSLGKNFVKAVGGKYPMEPFDPDKKLSENKTWHELLTTYCSYRDPKSLGWVDFRKHWVPIGTIKDYKEKIMSNDFDFSKYIWSDWPEEKSYTEENFYA